MVFPVKIIDGESGERIEINVDSKSKVSETIKTLSSYWDTEEDMVLMKGSELIPRETYWGAVGVDEDLELYLRRSEDVNKFPKEIWLKRLENEIKSLEDDGFQLEKKENGDFKRYVVILQDIPGPVRLGRSIGNVFEHHIQIRISREYPFKKPDVKWLTDIFHPNILPPEEGGQIKNSYLEDWDVSHNMLGMLSAIENVLLKPELENRIDHKICIEAAKMYLEP